MVASDSEYSKLKKEKTLIGYLEGLRKVAPSSIILLSVRDTPGFHFSVEAAGALMSLGIASSLHGAHGHCYVGVIDRGTIVADTLSTYDESILVENKSIYDGQITATVFSSVFRKENQSIIAINGIDYSQNRRGLNIVVYSCLEGTVVDSVAFDTHVEANTLFRSPIASSLQVVGMGDAVAYRLLSSQLAEQKKEISDLKTLVATNNEKMQHLLWQVFKHDGENNLDAQKRFARTLQPATGHLRKVQAIFNVMLRKFDQVCREHDIDYWLGFGTLLGAVRHGGFIPWDDDADVCMLRNDYLKLRDVMANDKDFCTYTFYDVDGPQYKQFGRGYKVAIRDYKTPYALDIFIFDVGDKLAEVNERLLNRVKKQMGQDIWEPGNVPDMPDSNIQHKRCVQESNPHVAQYEKFLDGYIKKYRALIGLGVAGKRLVWGIDNPNFSWGPIRLYDYNAVFPLVEYDFEGHAYLCPNNPDAHLEPIYGDLYTMPDDMLTHQHFTLKKSDEAILDKQLSRFYTQEELKMFLRGY